MRKREVKKSTHKKRPQDETEENQNLKTNTDKKDTDTLDELDDLLDEIDSVLEKNAEEFVKNYKQEGGQ